jgi:hypothetical protein
MFHADTAAAAAAGIVHTGLRKDTRNNLSREYDSLIIRFEN